MRDWTIRNRARILSFFCGLAVVLPAVVATSCSVPSPSPTGTIAPTVEGWQTEAVATAGTPVPVPVTIGLPYQPDVQFTPLYVAQERGYYRDLGFEVSFDYGNEADFVRLVARRSMPATIASGEQVILARAQQMPVTYVMTWYQRFGGAVFSDDTTIEEPADLVGKTVGLPAPSGASYTGWRALLQAAELDPDAITTEIIGYDQLQAVLGGRVDAAVGYAANEPVQARALGIDVSVIEIADYFNLVSNGLVVSEGLIMESPEVVQALVTGTLRGISDTIADPDSAFEIALQVVPEAGDPEVREIQRQVLAESINFWDAAQLGAIDTDAWQQSIGFLAQSGVMASELHVDSMVDQQFVDAAELSR